MNGKYRIIIKKRKLVYNFEVDRPVTIIKGNSGIGKSTLVGMVNSWIRNKKGGVKVVSDVDIDVFHPESDWYKILDEEKSKIFFADEACEYIVNKKSSKLFSEKLFSSGNYLVYTTRHNTAYLEYAVNSIYTIVGGRGKQEYIDRFEWVYNDRVVQGFKPDIIITEDSKSGFEVIREALKYNTVSAKGKSNVAYTIMKAARSGYKNIYVIVDGAAFGPEIDKVVRTVGLCREKYNADVGIFSPESFEYLCLCTETVKSKGTKIGDIINKTYDYIDYNKDHTWEKFYYKLLKDVIGRGFNQKYGKGEVPNVMRSDRFRREFKSLFRDIV